MAYISAVKIDSGSEIPIGSSLYGTCDTAAATAAKVVTMANFDTLKTGVQILVKFTYSNTVANPTLNVNSTGAKNIYRYGTTAPSTNVNTSWNAGSVLSFVYDGSAWQMVDFALRGNDNTNTWRNIQVNGTEILGTSTSTGALNLIPGSNVSITNSSGSVTIAATNTNNAVTQTATNTNANYEVLFSATADNTTRTEGARKYSNLLFNPSTGNLQATQLNGVTIGSSPKFTDTTYSDMTGATASAAGTHGLVPAPAAGKQASFLRGDGTWAVPSSTTYSAGTGLTLSGTTFNHTDSVTAKTTQAVYPITFNSTGHITGAGNPIVIPTGGNGFEIVWSGSYTGNNSLSKTLSTDLSSLPDYLLIIPNAPGGNGIAGQTAYNSSSIYIPIEQAFSWSSTISFHGTGVTVSGYIGTSTATTAFTAASGIISCTYPSNYSTNITFTLTGRMSSNIAIVGTGQTAWASRSISGWTSGQYLIAYNHSGITYKYYFLKAS